MITSTGFVTADFSKRPLFLPVLLIMIGFIGGCGGSTAGGLKVMRVYILVRLVFREMRYLLHPKAILSVRLSGHSAIPESTLQSVFSFLFLYVTAFVVLLLLMLADGVDVVSAFSSIATCMNNMGPALGSVAQSFAGLDDFAKMVSILAMLMGRLEVVPFLILFVPEYWR